MSTSTRRQKKSPGERLLSLAGRAIVLFGEGKRTDHQNQALLRALQLYKENRLGGVVSFRPGDPETVPENIHELLSLKIEDLGLSRQAIRYFVKKGIWYVGEAYGFVGHDDRKKAQSVVELEDTLHYLGVPTPFRPLELGWQPPYWKDPTVIEALSIPCIEGCSQGLAVRPHQAKTPMHYLGDIIRERPYLFSNLEDVQACFRNRVVRAGLHLFMLIPPDWQAPEEVPQAWTDFLEKQEREEFDLQISEGVGIFHVATEDPSMDVLMKNIDTLELSTRAYNYCLYKANCKYVGQLVQKNPEDLPKTSDHERKSLKEITGLLQKMGLSFGMNPDLPTIAAFNARMPARS